MRLVTLLLPTLLAALSLPLFAQGDTITRNPACVQLKRIWKLEGSVIDAQIGAGFGSVGDVNGDSIGDFAVYGHVPNYQWRVFYGSRDTIPTEAVWAMDTGSSATIGHPVVGDFWGTGHQAVGFTRSWLNMQTGRQYDWLRIFRTDSNKLEKTPSAIWYAVSWKDTTLRASLSDVLAADLDGDGDDEFIVALKWVTIEGRYGQIWIYDGGPGFQVQTPSIVIKDPELNENFYRLHAGDIDGDGRVDLMSVKYAESLTKTDFYWSSSGWPAAGRLPDRSVVTGDPQERDGANTPMLADCDGDGIKDLISSVARIWRSGSGKDPHTRAWSFDDADIFLRSAGGPFAFAGKAGYLNSKRYEMVATAWAPGTIYFSGGLDGPDLDYDALYYPGNDGLDGYVGDQSPVGDVNGDGWDDVITGRGPYPDRWTKSGIAIIIAGGPYIPNDEPTVGVRQITLENKSAALSLWPNPMREELNIAWRGDLQRMPRRFEIHDMLGRRVSDGEVPDGDGAAIWRSGGEPAGTYLLSIFDDAGARLAIERFVKE